MPLYAPICLLIASSWSVGGPPGAALAIGLLAMLVVATVPAAISRFDVNRDISVRAGAVAHERGQPRRSRALVFVGDTAPYLLYLNPFSSNGPELDDRVLYAADGSPAMLDLIASMPDRTPYLQRGSVPSQEIGPREDPYELQVSLTPVEVRRGSTLTFDLTVTPPEGAAVASVRVQAGAFDGTHTLAIGSSGGSVTDRFDVRGPTAAGTTSLPLDDRGAIRITVGFGASAEAATDAPSVRQEVQYRVVGGSIEVLLPATEQRRELVADGHQWRYAVGLRELRVAISNP